LLRADPPSEESYLLCKNEYETKEEVRAQQRAVEPLMNECLNYYRFNVLWGRIYETYDFLSFFI
jgi:hypothetical protein